MPIERYRIRNEFRLADPGLYGVAVSDDPEALLKGVAVAGLVGVLRQLGDLSQFAAEIFTGLHEELMATASRGQRMTVRILQVEAQLPQVEKAFITQTNRSHASSNPGTEWHPNIGIYQNVVSKTEAPKFISDTFEACRGPPQFHLLDKFDAAGKGACLKRYSDLSFFRAYFSFLETKEPHHRQEKVVKTKTKGLHSSSKENLEIQTDADVNTKSTNKDSSNVVSIACTKRIRLKKRSSHNLNTSIRRTYIECVLATDSNPNALCYDLEEFPQMEPIDSNSSETDNHEVDTDNESNNSVENQTGFSYSQEEAYELISNHEKLDTVETKLTETYNGSTGYARSEGSESLDADSANETAEITVQEVEQNEMFSDIETNEDSCPESFITEITVQEVEQNEMFSDIETNEDSCPESFITEITVQEVEQNELFTDIETNEDSCAESFITEITVQEVEQNELFTDIEANEDSCAESFIRDDVPDENNHYVNPVPDTGLDSVANQEKRMISGVSSEDAESKGETFDKNEELQEDDLQIQSDTESTKRFQNQEFPNGDIETKGSCSLITDMEADSGGMESMNSEMCRDLSQKKKMRSPRNTPKYGTWKARPHDATSVRSKIRGTSWDSFMTGSATFIDHDSFQAISNASQTISTGLNHSEHAENSEGSCNHLDGDSKPGDGTLDDECYVEEDSDMLLESNSEALNVAVTVHNNLADGQCDGMDSESETGITGKEDSEILQSETTPENISGEALDSFGTQDAFPDLTEDETRNLPPPPRKGRESCTSTVPQSPVDCVVVERHENASGFIGRTARLNNHSDEHDSFLDSSEKISGITVDIKGDEYDSLIINPVLWEENSDDSKIFQAPTDGTASDVVSLEGGKETGTRLPPTDDICRNTLEESSAIQNKCNLELSTDNKKIDTRDPSGNPSIGNPTLEDDRSQESCSTSEEESAEPFELSKELPMVENSNDQSDGISIEAEDTEPSFSALSSTNDEQSSSKQEASQKTFLHRQNQFASASPSQDESPNLLPHSSDRSLAAPNPEVTVCETKAVNLSLPPLPTSAKHVKPPKPPSMPVSSPGAVALPGMNALNKHGDASQMLKKVSVQSPKIEGMNMLLEEIRNQSYILKPLAAPRPYIKRPTTNLKLAAMLEKAHTLRIAVAGSDEDDDDDENNWD